MNDTALDLYYQAVLKLQEQLDSMAEVEHQKRAALLDHDMDAIESLLHNQQAMVMKLENLEKKRLSAQIAAGFADMKPEEILVTLDTEKREEFTRIFHALRASAQQMHELNAVSMDIVNTELRIMGEISPEAVGGKQGLYQANGKKTGGAQIGAAFEEQI